MSQYSATAISGSQEVASFQSRPEALAQCSESRDQEAFRTAREVYQQGSDWARFFREVLGVDGVVRRLFPNPADLAAFEKTEEYAKIQQMLAKLREDSKHEPDADEPTRVITVRLPKSLHESLRNEAHERRTSMNQLCISKLLQMIDNQLVPTD